MMIAVAASGKWLDAAVDSHTGRSPFFILYDTGEESFQVIDNSRRYRCQHWAGSQTAQMLSDSSIDVIIVRRIGPCAYRWFQNAGIPVFTTTETSIVKAIRDFREGMLTAIDMPNCEGHYHHAGLDHQHA